VLRYCRRHRFEAVGVTLPNPWRRVRNSEQIFKNPRRRVGMTLMQTSLKQFCHAGEMS